MEVKFRTYCGLAGDLQELLIAESESGIEESTLIPRTGLLRYFFLKKAKKQLNKRLEMLTGKKHKEN